MLVIDENGTVFLYQGDSGEIVVDGLDNSKNYTVYFAVQDKKRNLIGSEFQVPAAKTNSVTFILNSEFTDMLTVPNNKPYQIYYYGIKACTENNDEDTLFVENGIYGDKNMIVVFPRKVKGI